ATDPGYHFQFRAASHTIPRQHSLASRLPGLIRRPRISRRLLMKMVAGVVAILVAAPLFVSVQTTLAADARDTKAPAWKQDAGVHDTKDIIGTRIKNVDGKDRCEIDQLLIDRSG